MQESERETEKERTITSDKKEEQMCQVRLAARAYVHVKTDII